MKLRIRFALAVTLLVTMLVPLPTLAAPTPRSADRSDASFNTPAPTPRPRSTARPRSTPEPVETEPPAGLVPPPVSFAPTRGSLTVGYQEPGVLGQLPLLLASQQGYFEEAGFDEIVLVQTGDTLAELRSGDLDFAVVSSADAYPLPADEVAVRAVAGYQNYTALDGDHAGIALMAQEDLIAAEPATVVAFLSAYIRALQDLADDEGAADALNTLEQTDVSIDPEVAADWLAAVGAYEPFDGGFGRLDIGGGLGELSSYLSGSEDVELDLGDLVSQVPLNVAQALLDLPANPASSFLGQPGLASISVGMPADDGAPSPIVVAEASGFFEAVGFESVEILDVEEPLPGLLSGQIDFAILDAVDAADGVAQGLPLRAIAGHANYAGADGEYGGDVLVVSNELLETESSTVASFMIAYLQALGSLSDSVNAAVYAPHDGGFGAREIEGGLGELREYLAQQTGGEVQPEALLALAPLHFAQTWWGLPANPTATPAPSEES